MPSNQKVKKAAKRYYRKRVALFRLIDKIKLWPSRSGTLHGIRNIEKICLTQVRLKRRNSSLGMRRIPLLAELEETSDEGEGVEEVAAGRVERQLEERPAGVLQRPVAVALQVVGDAADEA